MPDEIDPKLRARYAWATGLAEDEPKEEASDEAADEREAATARARAQAWLAEVSRDVARAWELAGPDQRAASVALASRVAKHGIYLAGLAGDDPTGARLVRLLVRHHSAMRRSTWAHARALLSFLTLASDEVDETVLEVVRAGAWDMSFSMGMALEIDDESIVSTRPRLVRELAAIVADEQASFPTRALAAYFLDARATEARPALRHALRAPNIELRLYALSALGDGIDAESVRFLLEDAVVHPLTGTDYDTMDRYDRALLDAVRSAPPPEGHVPLERIVAGDCVHLGFRNAIDENWALAALAAGYPDRGAPLVDEWLAHGDALHRWWAVAAAKELPREASLERLRRALGDVSLRVFRAARKALDEMHEDTTPPPLALADLLPSPPSEVFLSRLDAARSVEDLNAFGEKLVPTLLAEAPDVEALVLWTMLADMHHARRDEAGEIFALFGEPARRLACRMVRLYPNGRHSGWAEQIREACATWEDDADAAERNALRDAIAADARDAVADVMRSPTWDGDACLPLLSEVGADERHLDVLWKLVVEDGEWSWPRHALATIRWPGLADRILAEARRAAEAGDHERFLRLIALDQVANDERRTPLLREVFEAAVSSGHVDLADVCVSYLRDAGFVDEAWILSHLAWGDPYVEIAAEHVHFDSLTSPRIVERLRALLASAPTAHAACVAMRGVLWTKSLPKRSQILGETLARASAEDAAHLAGGALLLDAPFSQVAPHLERIFANAPERDAFEIVERLHGVLSEKKRGARAHLRRVHDALAPGPVRDALARALRLPSEAETYWK